MTTFLGNHSFIPLRTFFTAFLNFYKYVYSIANIKIRQGFLYKWCLDFFNKLVNSLKEKNAVDNKISVNLAQQRSNTPCSPIISFQVDCRGHCVKQVRQATQEYSQFMLKNP